MTRTDEARTSPVNNAHISSLADDRRVRGSCPHGTTMHSSKPRAPVHRHGRHGKVRGPNASLIPSRGSIPVRFGPHTARRAPIDSDDVCTRIDIHRVVGASQARIPQQPQTVGNPGPVSHGQWRSRPWQARCCTTLNRSRCPDPAISSSSCRICAGGLARGLLQSGTGPCSPATAIC